MSSSTSDFFGLCLSFVVGAADGPSFSFFFFAFSFSARFFSRTLSLYRVIISSSALLCSAFFING